MRCQQFSSGWPMRCPAVSNNLPASMKSFAMRFAQRLSKGIRYPVHRECNTAQKRQISTMRLPCDSSQLPRSIHNKCIASVTNLPRYDPKKCIGSVIHLPKYDPNKYMKVLSPLCWFGGDNSLWFRECDIGSW